MGELRKTLESRLLTMNEYFGEAIKLLKKVWEKKRYY
jgi:hypothetical protein